MASIPHHQHYDLLRVPLLVLLADTPDVDTPGKVARALTPPTPYRRRDLPSEASHGPPLRKKTRYDLHPRDDDEAPHSDRLERPSSMK